MQKKWILKEQAEAGKIDELAESANISKPLANLLLQRGINDSESARKFFRPDLQQLYDPFLMKDMDKAVARLEQAIVERENVLIYGDYDVDGTTAVAMMYVFLKSKCRNVFYYVPDRYTEGYGISYKGIDYAEEMGCKLIIALDCGIKALPKVDYAAEKGIEFIICDHHEPGEELPRAAAVLDPKRADCSYPFNELSGCGVGFKLIQAYASRNKIPFYQIKPFLDLVVVSIASDIVPIIDENRILAYYGLKQLNTNPRVGLRAVMKKSGITPPPQRNKDDRQFDVPTTPCEVTQPADEPEFRPVKIGDIVFKIGPRINAAGRMDLGRYSVDLLVERNEAKAEEMACKIETDNTDRKTHDQNITNEALAVIDSCDELKNRRSTVLYNPEWHKGVIGIVASRLIDFYYRPTVICTKSNGLITGSARSIPDFNLYEAIEKCQSLLESFGGHTYAAGLTLKEENLEAFVEKFESVVDSMITDDIMVPRIDVDEALTLSDITPKFFKCLEMFEPFGPGNMAPVFVCRGLTDSGQSQLVGQMREHLKLTVVDESVNRPMSAIAFKQSEHFDAIHRGEKFDICFSLEMNTFRGKETLQLKVHDIKMSNGQ
ncbi:MAG: DHH family phosphoesterase [Salinivirgaceae bacterium]|nr:DHH family phosphoesterase [Salinivirgaceae bacterium]